MKYPALKVTMIYLVIGILWILLSDSALYFLKDQDSDLRMLQQLKGLLYVIITAAILYFLIRRFYSRQQKAREEYERVFREFPHPMWIYERKNLEILSVNKAAIKKYGYSRSEFLKLKITDLRAQEDVEKLKKQLSWAGKPFQKSGLWRHRKKSGELFFAEIFGSSVEFKNHDARLVLALDVHDTIIARQRILDQNAQLKQITHFQAHNMRGPVASILGLTSILDYTGKDFPGNLEVIENIKVAAQQLDSVIHEIVKVSQQHRDETE